MLLSHATAHVAPTLVSEYVVLHAMSPRPEISKRTVEQVVGGTEDDADIRRQEQMLLGYQANIDHCFHMLKTKKEEV